MYRTPSDIYGFLPSERISRNINAIYYVAFGTIVSIVVIMNSPSKYSII